MRHIHRRHRRTQINILNNDKVELLIPYYNKFLNDFQFNSDLISFLIKLNPENIRIIEELHNKIDTKRKRYLLKTYDEYEISRVIDEVVEELPLSEVKKEFQNISFNKKSVSNDTENKIQQLVSYFDISENEAKLLQLIHVYLEEPTFSSLLEQTGNLNYQLNYLGELLELNKFELMKLIDYNSKIIKYGFLEIEHNLDLSLQISLFFEGMNDIHGIAKEYFEVNNRKTFPLSSFNLSEENKMVLTKITSAQKSSQILLYGLHGAGKTELARTLIKNAKKRGLWVSLQQRSRFRRGLSRVEKLELTVQIARQGKDIVVVDEAESLLNISQGFFSTGSYDNKAWINTFLDNCPATVIWIVNHLSAFEKSTARRIDFSLQMKPLTESERAKRWYVLLKKYKELSWLDKLYFDKLAKDFDVSIAIMDKSIQSMIDTLQKETFEHEVNKEQKQKEMLRFFLIQAIQLENLNFVLQKEKIKEPNFTLEYLNTDTNIKTFFNSIKKYNPKKRGGINLLFWGMSGTGETALAKELAKKSKKKIIIKQASDLKSKWWGETEKNIHLAFEEAEKDEAILLIDEADTFVKDRTKGGNVHTDIINQFLTSMENHKIIFIATTNLLEMIDNASMRRFQYKVKFKPLRKKHRVSIFNSYFSEYFNKPLTRSQEMKIEAIDNLTAGDFRAIWQKYRIIDKKEIDVADVISDLKKEVSYKETSESKIEGF